MDAIKKALGVVWLLLSLVVLYYGLTEFGLPKLNTGNQEDLIFGLIIVFILLPIIFGGLAMFGWYALKGEYSKENM